MTLKKLSLREIVAGGGWSAHPRRIDGKRRNPRRVRSAEQRERDNAAARRKYHSDPEYRAKKIAAASGRKRRPLTDEQKAKRAARARALRNQRKVIE